MKYPILCALMAVAAFAQTTDEKTIQELTPLEKQQLADARKALSAVQDKILQSHGGPMYNGPITAITADCGPKHSNSYEIIYDKYVLVTTHTWEPCRATMRSDQILYGDGTGWTTRLK